MFRHIYTNRLKCLLRNRILVFWTILFPVALSLFFYVSFSNITNAASFKSIPIAVVDNAEYRGQTRFISMTQELSQSEQPILQISLQSKEQAEESLKDNAIQGYIYFDGGAHVVFAGSGTQQNIIKEYMDSFLQYESAYTTIMTQNQGKMPVQTTQDSYLQNITYGSKASPDTFVAYFYALLAMAALYGGFWGQTEVEDAQANMSPSGARKNMAPVHKLKAFFYSYCASVTVHFLSLVLFTAFLILVLHIDFGRQLGYVLLTCFAGSMAGISSGAALSVLLSRFSSGVRTGFTISLSMIFASLAGLQNINVKYAVTQAVPALAYLNPACLISDAFYALYYYTTYSRFFLNIGLLFGMSAVFLMVVYFVMRRQRYANL